MDAEDLLARLGGEQDRPVVGDWDGDGKEDIGIYGPMWPNDIEAINQEPAAQSGEHTVYKAKEYLHPPQPPLRMGLEL